MKKIIFFLSVMLLVLTAFATQANQLTHAIGTTGYMIQEAMWAGASKLAQDDYARAVALQYESKDYMRGTHRQGRHTAKALELTTQAFELAKKARDVALQQTGGRVSH